MRDKYTPLLNAMSRCPLMPVLTLEEGIDAPALAAALKEGGLDAVEVTLRTPNALQFIEEMKRDVPTLMIGAGTITTSRSLQQAINAGSDFIVTPGTTYELMNDLLHCRKAVFPGVSTVSEAMTMYNAGFIYQKFFPAEASGGTSFLKSIAGPLPDIHFMPTGGISPTNIDDYLGLKNVISVGGSWMVKASDIRNQNWREITKRLKSQVKTIKNSKAGKAE